MRIPGLVAVLVTVLGARVRPDRGRANGRHHRRNRGRSEPERVARRDGHGAKCRYCPAALRRDRRGRPLCDSRIAAWLVRSSRRVVRLQASHTARRAVDHRAGARVEHHAGSRRADRRSHGDRPDPGDQHVERGVELSRGIRRDRAAAAQRTQLHRPRAAAAGCARVSSSRWRIGRRARSRDERQRTGSPLERLPARRHTAERLHQWSGGQRRRHLARHRDDSRVQGRIERLQRGVRPELRRTNQRADQVRREHRRWQPVRVPSQRRARREELLRHRRAAGLLPQSVRRHDRRTDRPGPQLLLSRL